MAAVWRSTCGESFLLVSEGQSVAGCFGVAGNDDGHAVAAERKALGRREQRVAGTPLPSRVATVS